MIETNLIPPNDGIFGWNGVIAEPEIVTVPEPTSEWVS